jgi:hypothetical protein
MAKQGAFGGPAFRLSDCPHGAPCHAAGCSVADSRKRSSAKMVQPYGQDLHAAQHISGVPVSAAR